MKRKRESEYFNQKIDHDIIFQNGNCFSITNKGKLEDIRQLNESRNAINELQSVPNNYETNNFKGFLSESSNNLKQKKNNRFQINKDDKERKAINNVSKIKKPSTKKYFNIEKNISEKNLLEIGNCNEIKAFKNKK